MAKFNCVGLQELEVEISKRAALLDEAAPAMLKAGTDILVEYQRGSIIAEGLVDSYDMLDSIKAGPVKAGKDGYYQEVWPHGVDHKGVRNAQKGFIHEYGTSRSDRLKAGAPDKHKGPKRNITATHWMEKANNAAKEEVVEAMRDVWNGHTERTDT